MAITSKEPEVEELPGIILVAIRAASDDLINFEKAMRQKGLSTLQKRELDVSVDAMKSWFSGEVAEDSNLLTTGYVIQSRNVENIWEEIMQEFGGDICGIAPEEELRRFFPSVVLDDYLLQPTLATEYLHQVKPTLLAGLQDICDQKPEDPVGHLALYLKNSYTP